MRALSLLFNSLCSLGGPAGFVEPGIPYVIARASADTSAGLAFELRRVGGRSIPAEFRPGARVVIVPWTYGADCRPLQWNASMQFLPPDEERFLVAAPRARERWINGLPTLDLYGQQPERIGMRLGGLAPEAAFDLFETLPTLSQQETDGWASLDAVMRWAAANRDHAGRPTIQAMFSMMARRAEAHRIASSSSPVRGTWDVRITLPSGREVRTWIRTATTPASVGGLSFWGVDAHPISDPWLYRARGYSLHFWNAPDTLGLPQAGSPSQAQGNWPWEVETGDSVFDGRRVTRAMLELGSATWTTDVDPEVSRVLLDYEERTNREISERKPYVPSIGRLFESADGMRFEQVVHLDSTRRLFIRGLRVSERAVAGDGYPRP